MADRRDGYYWVKLQGEEPEVVHSDGGIFYRAGSHIPYTPDHPHFNIEHISEVPLTVPIWITEQQPLNVVEAIHKLRAQVMQISSSELNTPELRKRISILTNEVMTPFKQEGKIHDFVFMCDDTNNSPEVIDSGEFRWILGVKYTPALSNIAMYRVGYNDDDVVGKWEF